MKIEDLNLYALKYFFDAVEEKSLTKAADLNFVTRSAISQSIVRLEAWAGKNLTTHEKKLFRLTKEGEIFYRQMKRSYEGFQKSVELAEQSSALRIGCSQSLCEALLFPALRKMKSLESMHLSTGTSAQLIHRLSEGDINLALFIEDSKKQENKIVLHSGKFVLASQSGRFSTSIITTEMRPEVIALHRAIAKRKTTAPHFLTIESWSLAAKLALETESACLIPDLLVKNGLKKIPMPGFSLSYDVILKHKSRELLSESETRLIDKLREL